MEEDGIPQSISTFAAGEFPLAVAIGVDRSFSVTPERLAAAKAAARSFVQQLRPADQAMVIAAGSEVEIVAPLSANHAEAAAALDRLTPWGTTPLHDATLAALDVIQAASGRRALILLSDGEDRYSRTSSAALVAEARRRDVLFYPVATGRKRPELFAELASVTGGRTFHAAERRDLETALGAIARELRLRVLSAYADVGPAPRLALDSRHRRAPGGAGACARGVLREVATDRATRAPPAPSLCTEILQGPCETPRETPIALHAGHEIGHDTSNWRAAVQRLDQQARELRTEERVLQARGAAEFADDFGVHPLGVLAFGVLARAGNYVRRERCGLQGKENAFAGDRVDHARCVADEIPPGS